MPADEKHEKRNYEIDSCKSRYISSFSTELYNHLAIITHSSILHPIIKKYGMKNSSMAQCASENLLKREISSLLNLPLNIRITCGLKIFLRFIKPKYGH